jgi:hypothetical protein
MLLEKNLIKTKKHVRALFFFCNYARIAPSQGTRGTDRPSLFGGDVKSLANRDMYISKGASAKRVEV